MELSKKALMRAVNSVPEGDDVGVWVVGVCRAVESEVRKHDEAMILQLVEALENSSDLVFKDTTKADARDLAITAGRARLEPMP